MNKSFDAGFDSDQSPEVGQAGDRAGDALVDGESYGLPRFGLKLLEAEGDFLGCGIDFEDFELEFLAYGEDVFGLGDAHVGDVGDMQQAVEAADVDESAVGHEGADGAGDDGAFLQLLAASIAEAAGLLFEDDTAIHDDVLI